MYPISVTEGGIVICFNEEHLVKTPLSIFVMEEGRSKLTSAREVQFPKRPSGRVVTEEGIVIDFSEMQFENNDFPSSITDVGIVTFLSSLHSLNAKLQIDVTDDGISISSSDAHLEKALPLIVAKLEGVSNVTCFNELHSENELTPISFIVEGITTPTSCLFRVKQFWLMILMEGENVTEN